jgi:hypothetical protein
VPDPELVIAGCILLHVNRLWYGLFGTNFLAVRLTRIDRPTHAVVFLSFAVGVTLISFHRSYPNFCKSNQEWHQEGNLPLEGPFAPVSGNDVSRDRHKRNYLAQWQTLPRLLLVGAIVSLVVRIELLRRILKATECTVSSVEV